MPLLLKPCDPSGKFESGQSVLFVACHVCPRMCLAVEKKEPYFSLSQLLGKGDYFKEFITDMRDNLEREEVQTDYYRTPFMDAMLCLWPEKLRKQLARSASRFDAIAVVGCQSAVYTVSDAVGQSPVKIVQLMEEHGVANFKTRTRFPFRMELSE